MKFPIHLTKEQIKQLEFEVLSQEFYVYLTRHLLSLCEESEDATRIIMQKNRLINLSKTILGHKIYTLDSDDWGNYEAAEHAWHDSHFLLIFRELSTIQFIEYACDLINYEYLEIEFLNDALENEGASFYFKRTLRNIEVCISSIEELEEANIDDGHINIRILVSRMDKSYENEDYANVLHASASIFETMAKDIIGIPTIQDQTLKSFFNRYKQDSNLSDEVLDYILATYDQRNVTALAGHGSLVVPDISRENSIILIEMTKAFVRIEYRIQKEI